MLVAALLFDNGLLVAALLFDDPNSVFVVLFDTKALVVVLDASKTLLVDPNALVELLLPKAEVMCVQRLQTCLHDFLVWFLIDS